MKLKALCSQLGEATNLLKSLANEDRLTLLCQLVEGERTVSDLEKVTGIHQPTLSQQLGILRNEGLVNTRRDGKWIYYSVSSTEVLCILDSLHGIFSKDKAQRLEVA